MMWCFAKPNDFIDRQLPLIAQRNDTVIYSGEIDTVKL